MKTFTLKETLDVVYLVVHVYLVVYHVTCLSTTLSSLDFVQETETWKHNDE